MPLDGGKLLIAVECCGSVAWFSCAVLPSPVGFLCDLRCLLQEWQVGVLLPRSPKPANFQRHLKSVGVLDKTHQILRFLFSSVAPDSLLKLNLDSLTFTEGIIWLEGSVAVSESGC